MRAAGTGVAPGWVAGRRVGVFGVTRTQLAEELGIDPGSALRCLEHDILAQAPVLDWQPRPVVPTAAAASPPVAAPALSPVEEK
jgi:hypothetical protein